MSAYDDARWRPQFISFLQRTMDGDTAHGLDHVQRVVVNARRIGRDEDADPAIYLPAAWLHDCVAVSKAHPERARASTLAAAAATAFLQEAGYPAHTIPAIAHAIEAHSFSAGIAPRTLEARVVQDADRLEALGAIGIARCLMVGEKLGRRLYDPADPFCTRRAPDDGRFTIDHFYAKLLKLPALLQTASGRQAAAARAHFLTQFLQQLAQELGPAEPTADVSAAP